MTNDEIINIFTYHEPKEGQPERYHALRVTAQSLALLINHHCPESRKKVAFDHQASRVCDVGERFDRDSRVRLSKIKFPDRTWRFYTAWFLQFRRGGRWWQLTRRKGV